MSISREVLAKYITQGCVFVETGTKWGDTCIRAMELGAQFIFTCEIDGDTYQKAAEHIADALRDGAKRVKMANMSSVKMLSELYEVRVDVVYLDAHTDKHSPILEELAVIGSQWRHPPRVILIDDLRCMKVWRIPLGKLGETLQDIATYAVSYENGIVGDDILVGRLSL